MLNPRCSAHFQVFDSIISHGECYIRQLSHHYGNDNCIQFGRIADSEGGYSLIYVCIRLKHYFITSRDCFIIGYIFENLN